MHIFDNNKCSVCSYNIQTLFGQAGAYDFTSKRKIKFLRSLTNKYTVVGIQESHGSYADLLFLRHSFPDHLVVGTFDKSHIRAGTLLFIRKKFHNHTLQYDNINNDNDCEVSITPHTIEKGRCIGVTVRIGSLKCCFVNVHVEPNSPTLCKHRLFNKIAKYLRKRADHVAFFFGDFNFVHSDESRLQVSSGNYSNSHRCLGLHFENTFDFLTEIYQDQYTRRGMDNGRLANLSRIDRVYTNLFPGDLLDLSPTCSTVGSITNGKLLSDHVPVASSVSIVQPAMDQCKKLPKWIFSHPDFDSTFNLLWDDCPDFLCPFEKLEFYKSLLYDVFGILQKFSIKHSASSSNAEHIFWTLRAIRASRDFNVTKIKRCCQAYPALGAFFDDYYGNVENTAIHSKLSELVQCDISDMNKLVDGITSSADKEKARVRISHWTVAWSPKRRKVKALTILRDDGTACSSVSESATILHNHWSPRFCTPNIDREDMAPLIPYIQTVQNNNDIQWILSYSDFMGIISSKKDSGVGPDGVPYSAYKLTGDVGGGVLYDCYVQIMKGAFPNDKFNHSFLWCLPKAALSDRQDANARFANETRALSGSNGDQKIIGTAIISPAKGIAQHLCHDAQGGLLRGRKIQDCLLSSEAAAIQSSMTRHTGVGWFFADIANAYPSVALSWLVTVLCHMQLPCVYIFAILAMYNDCVHHICIKGRIFSSFTMSCGVKQGCPMSSVLFALCLDPWIRYVCWLLPPEVAHIKFYADDLNAVLFNTKKSFSILFNALLLLGKATNLHLNYSKCIFIPLWQVDFDRLRTWFGLTNILCEGFKIQNYAKLLGIYVGPGAADRIWTEALLKLHERSFFVKDCGLGLTKSIYLFNQLAFPVLSYISSLCPPSKYVLQQYHNAMQRLVRGPWMAIPMNVLTSCTRIGMPFEIVNLVDYSKAAMFRVAATSDIFGDICRSHDSISNGDNALFDCPLKAWYSRSIGVTLRINMELLENNFVITRSDSISRHKMMYASLRCLDFPDAGLFKVLRARIGYWYRREFSDDRCDLNLLTSTCIKNFNYCATILPAGILAAMLRVVCNALCTKVRFHRINNNDDSKSCLFCGLVGGDNTRHMLCDCNLVIDAFKISTLCGWRVSCCPYRWQSMIFSNVNDPSEHVLAFAIFSEFVIKLHNVIRTSHEYDKRRIEEDGIVRFFAARIRHWSRDSSSFSSFVCQDVLLPARKKKRYTPKVFNVV
jgi:hypothetical protein